MHPKVSVIIPIYDVEKYLQRCIDSLFNQTLRDIEIILVDDGSPDNCGLICDENAQKDERIKVIHKKNGGVSEARNFGIDEARGEYLLFIDPDDWCEYTMIEELFNSISAKLVDIAVCGYSIDYTNNNFSIKKPLVKKIFKKDIAEAIYLLDIEGMLNVLWNKLYKRDIIKKHNLYFVNDFAPGQDMLFNSEYFKYIQSISFISNELYHYMRQDEDTLVSIYNPRLYNNILTLNSARKSLYEFYNMSSAKYIKCFADTYKKSIASSIPNIFRKNCTLTIKEKKHFIKTLMQDDELKRYFKISKAVSFYDKLFYRMIKIGSPHMMYMVYFILFKFRYGQDGMYRLIRKQIMK